MEIIPTILHTRIEDSHLIGRREGRFHLIDTKKDKVEEYEISAAVINDLEKEAISNIKEQSARPLDRQPTPYEEAVALHGERKIRLLLFNTIRLSKNMFLNNHSKDSPNTKSTSKEESLQSQCLLIPKLMKYLKARDPNTTLNIEGGVCSGLTSLYCYYQFIGKSQDFFDTIRKVHSIVDKSSFKKVNKKKYKKLTKNQQFLERFCNDLLFFQAAHSFGSSQTTFLKNMNFVSEDPAIQKLRSQFAFSSAFYYNDKKQSHVHLANILYQILTSDIEKRKLLFMSTGYHAFGIHYQDKKCYLYNPNTSGDQYTCLIDPENPFPAIESLTKQLISELFLLEKKSISLGILVLSDENLSVLKTKEASLHSQMITHSRDSPGKEYSPLLIASRHNSKDVVKTLLRKGAYPNAGTEKKITPLHDAAFHGYKDLVEILLETGADPNIKTKNEITPLHNAAFYGHKDIVEILLEAGADPNIRANNGVTPLHDAAQQGSKDITRILLKWGANPNIKDNNGITPLHYAAFNRHKDIVEILLEAGADLNIRDNNGVTPLHDVARQGHKDIVEILLGAGADPNIRANNGFTPLHDAAFNRDKDIVEILLEAGADPNIRDNNGVAPLHNAAFNRDKDIVEILLGAGADPNIRANNGFTPLHDAAQQGHKVVLEILLGAGADPNIRDENEDTPLDIAAFHKHKDIVKILRGREPKPYKKTSKGRGFSSSQCNIS